MVLKVHMRTCLDCGTRVYIIRLDDLWPRSPFYCTGCGARRLHGRIIVKARSDNGREYFAGIRGDPFVYFSSYVNHASQGGD